MILLALRATHLLFMGLWVGAVMYLGGDVRRSVAAGPEHLPLLRDRTRRALRFTHICAGVTLASGLALIVELGGFGAVQPAVHIGFALAIGLALLGILGVGGTWAAVDRALGEPESADRVSNAVLRLGVMTSLLKTGWLVVFFLMVFRNR
ncbi:MAG: hypothetical protein KDA24_22540 [Deltaproteobacteria bacterium]|nr:hypothetical protein [Deltaproteobacteria bacterium]